MLCVCRLQQSKLRVLVVPTVKCHRSVCHPLPLQQVFSGLNYPTHACVSLSVTAWWRYDARPHLNLRSLLFPASICHTAALRRSSGLTLKDVEVMHANLHGSLAAYGVDASRVWIILHGCVGGLQKRPENPRASRISVFASPEMYERLQTRNLWCVSRSIYSRFLDFEADGINNPRSVAVYTSAPSSGLHDVITFSTRPSSNSTTHLRKGPRGKQTRTHIHIFRQLTGQPRATLCTKKI